MENLYKNITDVGNLICYEEILCYELNFPLFTVEFDRVLMELQNT